MALPNRAATSVLFVAALAGLCPAQEWTEAGVVQKFLDQSPQAREARARVAIAEAATRGRVLYANPKVNYSREGAGLNEFFQAEQTLPITGRLKLLRQAGSALVRATEADGAFDERRRHHGGRRQDRRHEGSGLTIQHSHENV